MIDSKQKHYFTLDLKHFKAAILKLIEAKEKMVILDCVGSKVIDISRI